MSSGVGYPAGRAPGGRYADRVAGHLLHGEPDGTFAIHDRITWCVVGGLGGVEHEELFDEALNPVGTRDNPPGEVSGFAPPGDIHRGTDITRVGSSARRYYN